MLLERVDNWVVARANCHVSTQLLLSPVKEINFIIIYSFIYLIDLLQYLSKGVD